MPTRIPIAAAKRLAKQQGLSHVVIVAWDGNLTHVVTYGTTVEACEQAAAGGNRAKKALGWPEELCNDEPSRVRLVKRRCAEMERQLEELAAVNEHHVRERNEAMARPMSPEAIRRGKEAIRRLRAKQADTDEAWLNACADAHGSGQECERDRVKRELEAWIAETEATGMLDFSALRKVTDWTITPALAGLQAEGEAAECAKCDRPNCDADSTGACPVGKGIRG